MLKTQQALGLLLWRSALWQIFSYGNILDHATKTFAVTAISAVKFFITCLVSKILKDKKKKKTQVEKMMSHEKTCLILKSDWVCLYILLTYIAKCSRKFN